jgi:hypothetical protein
MNSDCESFQQRLDAALSLPKSAQQFLYVYWLAATEWLKRCAEESKNPQVPPRTAEGLPEWMQGAEESVAKSNEVMDQLRCIEGYLGHAPRKIDPKNIQDSKSLHAVKWIRAAIQEGWSDEWIACWLSSYLSPSTRAERGRPAGTVDLDGHAVIALTLHESDPKRWSYPMLADEFFKCTSESDTLCLNEFGKHTADSVCVDKLKKAVARLRTFLQELGYKPAGK